MCKKQWLTLLSTGIVMAVLLGTVNNNSSLAFSETMDNNTMNGSSNNSTAFSSLASNTSNFIACGSTITQSTNLTADFGPCLSSDTKNDANLTDNIVGLKIDADKITLDCNGHTILGNNNHSTVYSESNVGIKLMNRSGVTITNCKIMGFDSGIGMINATNNTFIGNLL